VGEGKKKKKMMMMMMMMMKRMMMLMMKKMMKNKKHFKEDMETWIFPAHDDKKAKEASQTRSKEKKGTGKASRKNWISKHKSGFLLLYLDLQP
jgi:hypothetical protein